MMKKFNFERFTHIAIAVCVMLLALSYLVDVGAGQVLLAIAAIGTVEIVIACFGLKFSFDTKLLNIILFLLVWGREAYLLKIENLDVVLFSGALLLALVSIVRFSFFMNKYCQRDAEDHLDM